VDDGARETLLREAVKLAMDDVALMPLYNLTSAWATRRGLRYEPRLDERTSAMGLRRAE
jgi:peptide/nickel transport system substrate-binding protein